VRSKRKDEMRLVDKLSSLYVPKYAQSKNEGFYGVYSSKVGD